MTAIGWAQIALVLVAVLAAALPLSSYIVRVLAGERTLLTPVLMPVERVFYKLSGVDPAREQSWFAYTIAMLAFSVVGFVSLYALQRLQESCRSIRKVSAACRPISPSTPRSASSPTPTGRTIVAKRP